MRPRLLRVVPCLLTLLVVASVRPAAAAPQATKVSYYYCYAFDHPRGSMWVTPVRPAGPDQAGLLDAWLKYVKANFVPTANANTATCVLSSEDVLAGDRRDRPSRLQSKVVDVDWSFWKNAETAAAAGALNQAAASGQYVLCYSDPGQSPLYLSSDLHIDVPLPPAAQSGRSDGGASARALDALKAEFLAYLKADRGYRNSTSYPATCQGAQNPSDVTNVRELLKQRFSRLTFVETGWQPGMKPAPAAAPASSPAAPPAADAYAKALAAERPAPHASPAPAPAPPRAAAAPAAPATYSYCYAYGTPAGQSSSAGKQHFYVSQPFQLAASDRPNQAFESFLRGGHAGEAISASCLRPGTLEAAQQNRQTTIDARRKQPAAFEVIEVVWKR